MTETLSLRRMSVVSILLATAALARPAQGAPPAFPADPNQWINSPPISAEGLEGKAIVLYFYEEGCPKCRAKWPGLLETAKKFQDKPVVFIAVNSGNQRPQVQSYVTQTKIAWPVLVDADRSFERQCEINPEVSLNNIYQVRYFDGAGKMNYGNVNEFEATIQKALEGASWQVDPAGIPQEMKGAWLQVETAKYAAAGPAIKRGLASKKDDVKTASEKLQGAVNERIAARVSEAKSQAEQGNLWAAYKIYLDIGHTFKGYELPAEVAAEKTKLESDEAVKNELEAFKKLDQAKKTGARNTAPTIRRAAAMLRTLIDDYPDTEGATEAQKLLDQIGAVP